MHRSDLKYLEECFKDEDMPKELSAIRLCELGNQRIRIKPVYSKISKIYLTAIMGINHISIDINGNDGTLQYDLAEPIINGHLLNSFHILTNYGTSEHIKNQYQCFSNMHYLCKKNALFIHSVPWEGDPKWENDKDYVYTFDFFRNLANNCHYKIMKEEICHRRGNCHVTMKKMEDNIFPSEKFFNQTIPTYNG